jgi:RNA polymerase sigma factor (TIGR02999 family)
VPESPSPQTITPWLRAWQGGDDSARNHLITLVYPQLKAIAARHLRREAPHLSLGPTALLHEAFLRLTTAPAAATDRTSFFGICAHLMREILVDHARARLADKRGGRWRRADSSALTTLAEAPDWDLLALDEALRDLATLNERQARAVELRYFGGLGVAEIAAFLGVSVATVRRDWETARAWLYRRLERRPEA